MTERILIDSNVLAYAYDNSSVHHDRAKKVVEKLLIHESAVMSLQNFVEFSRIACEKLPRKLSYEKARKIVVELSRLVEVIGYDAPVIADALSFSSNYGIHLFDALIVATMEKAGVDVIYTENEKDFAKIPWITAVNPFRTSAER